VIVDFIDAAQFSLQAAAQELDNTVIADALDRAARRSALAATPMSACD
jgi:hypothetical protein